MYFQFQDFRFYLHGIKNIVDSVLSPLNAGCRRLVFPFPHAKTEEEEQTVPTFNKTKKKRKLVSFSLVI